MKLFQMVLIKTNGQTTKYGVPYVAICQYIVVSEHTAHIKKNKKIFILCLFYA
jgi:hypothetical protein